MTLDEAIKHCEEKAKELRTEAEQLRDLGEVISSPKQPYNEPVKNCLNCAEEHKELAEWLKDYKRLLEEKPQDCSNCKRYVEVKFDKEQMQELVDKAKAEVLASIERPQGEWIDTGDMEEYWAEEYQCSICGTKDHWHNYCPNCGAEMRR